MKKRKNIGEIADAYEEMQTRIGRFPEAGERGELLDRAFTNFYVNLRLRMEL